MRKINTVFVTVVNHRHGTDIWVNKTNKGALRALYKYVQEWWEDSGVPGKCPEETSNRGRQMAIETYFSKVADNSVSEWYEMEERKIYA